MTTPVCQDPVSGSSIKSPAATLRECTECFPPPPCDSCGLDTTNVNSANFSSGGLSDDMGENTAMNGPAPTAVYLYAGDQIIENVTMGYLYFQDSLGNTSHVTDSAGNLLERYTYSAFGIPTILSTNNTQLSTSAYGIKHLFQGQLWTQETALYDYRNRVELPIMGVFMQPDPIGFKGDAANVYRFCNNNAVNRIDPTGLYLVIDKTNASNCFVNPDLPSVTEMERTLDQSIRERSPGFTGAIHWKETGNWTKKELADHLSNDKEYNENHIRLAGWTDRPTFKAYPEIAENGRQTGNLTAELTVNWWISSALSSEDQNRIMNKELDHPREFREWASSTKDRAFFEIRRESSTTEAATHLQSFIEPRLFNEFKRQQSVDNITGRHGIPVHFLDES